MSTLYVTYDPFDTKATFVPDGLLEQWAKELVLELQDGDEDIHIIVATDTCITVLRVMIRESNIAAGDIVFKFNDKTVPHLPTGKIERWPVDMGDWLSKLLQRLI